MFNIGKYEWQTGGLDVKIILFVELDFKAVKCRKPDVTGGSLVYYLTQILNNRF
jgi:hypothetical protein